MCSSKAENIQRGYGDEWNHWLGKKIYVRMLIFKVDFEKVYDLVSLGFLDYILGKFGFYEW